LINGTGLDQRHRPRSTAPASINGTGLDQRHRPRSTDCLTARPLSLAAAFFGWENWVGLAGREDAPGPFG
jgi:hypothetical protein